MKKMLRWIGITLGGLVVIFIALGAIGNAMMTPEQKASAEAAREKEHAAAEKIRAEEAKQKQVDEERRDAQRKTEEEAKAQARLMADFPKCESEEAQIAVARVLEKAPLGRVYGLSLIKINNAAQVAVSSAARDCTGSAKLNNTETYPMTYRFYRDDKDIMIEANIAGLDR